MIDQIKAAAAKLENETLRNNAEALIARMTSTSQGIGDEIRRWHPSNLRIVQATTDVDSIDGDVRPGDLVYGNVKAPKDARVFLLRAWDSRTMWNPDLNIKSIMCSSPDGKVGWRFGDCKSCENGKFQDGTPSLCRQQKSFLAVTEDFSDIVVIHLSRTQLSIGRDLESKLRKMATLPYMRLFALQTKKSEKSKAISVLDPVRTDDYANDNAGQFLTALFDYFVAERRDELAYFYNKIKEYKESKQAEKAAEGSSQDDVDISADSGAPSGGDTPRYEM